MKKRIKIIILTLLILIVALPFVFTQFSSCFPFNDKSSIIGETIGGITAPLVSILGALIIYTSFKEQVKFNSHQVEYQNIERFRNDFVEIKNEFHRVEFNEDEIHKSLKNESFESAIEIYVRDLEKNNDGNISFEYQFKYVLYLIQYFIIEIEKSNLRKQNKKLIIKKLYQFYYSRIQYHIEESIELADKLDYNVPFIVLAKKVSKLIEDRRRNYGIKDPGVM